MKKDIQPSETAWCDPQSTGPIVACMNNVKYCIADREELEKLRTTIKTLQGKEVQEELEAYILQWRKLKTVAEAAEEYYRFPSSHNRAELKDKLAALRKP